MTVKKIDGAPFFALKTKSRRHLIFALVALALSTITISAMALTEEERIDRCVKYLLPATFEETRLSLKHSQIISGILPFNAASDLSNRLKPQFEKIYSYSMTAQQKANAVYNLYLETRLAALTPTQRKKVLEVANSKVTFVFHFGKMSSCAALDCFFNLEDKSVSMNLPIAYENSLLMYALMAHEVEHAIQDVISQDDPEIDTINVDLEITYQKEKGAMSAEATFLLAVPKEVLFRNLQQLLDDADLPEVAKPFYASMFRGAHWADTVEEYVTDQWKQKRYTRASIDRFLTARAIAVGKVKSQNEARKAAQSTRSTPD